MKLVFLLSCLVLIIHFCLLAAAISFVLCFHIYHNISYSAPQVNRQELKCLWWFERKWLPEGVALLGNVALLEQVWSFWRKCITVAAGFEVLYVLKPHPRSQTTSYCLPIKMWHSQHHVCQDATTSIHNEK